MALHLLRQPAASPQTLISYLWRPLHSLLLNQPLLIGIVENRNFEGSSANEALGDEVVDSILVFHVGDKDYLRVGPAHRLQSLQVSDLHGRLAVELVSCQPHQLCSLNVGLGGKDLALSQSPLLGGGGEGVLEVLAELNVLDENLFYLCGIYLTSTPHSIMYWSTCFSISSAISCLFSSKSWSMNWPQVFLRIA